MGNHGRMRFFRTSDENLYESVRLQLDAAWGHPDQMTATCFDPLPVAARDAQGRVLLGVNDEFCGYSVAVEMLPQLLSLGLIEEISKDEYQATVVASMQQPS